MRENEMTRERKKLGEAQIEAGGGRGGRERVVDPARISSPVFSGGGGARERGRKDCGEGQRWRCAY